jgi:glycosyltransferase involved in cell wall biosynthesis
MKKIWISWHYSQRSRSLAKELQIPILEYVNEANIFSRHFLSSLWSLYILFKKRPLIVYLQYSFMLLYVALLYKATFRRKNIKIICDCHTKALRRKLKNIFSKPFFLLKKTSFKASNICIISNRELIDDILEFSTNYLILPDPIPNLRISRKHYKKEKPYCVYSNSYAEDEPFEKVIEAANKLNGVIKIFCTGRIPKKLKFLKTQPYRNIYFTDYLKDDMYADLIANAKCILALTFDESTLLCSGYEALSVNTPLVISDTRILREYFQDSVLFTKNSSDDVVKNIIKCLSIQKRIKTKMQILKKTKNIEQKLVLANLKELVLRS